MGTVEKIAVAVGMAAAAGPVYWAFGLTPGQAGASSALAALGCTGAFLVPFAGRRKDAVPLPKSTSGGVGHVEEALATAGSIQRIARRVADPRICASLLKMADSAREGLTSLQGRSLSPGARRMIAYYLPQASRLAKTALSLESLRQPRPDQVEAVVAMLARLEAIFDRFADDATAPETGDIERELALLGDALDRDA